MKYEMMQLINRIRDNINELDETGISNPLLDEIYELTAKLEDIIEDVDGAFTGGFDEEYD